MKECIIGFQNERAVYDYSKLIEYFTKSFLEVSDDLNQANEYALEWIHYNVLRSIPYLGENAPLVVDVVELHGDVPEECIVIDNIKYEIIS
jgi:hypothetical protein